MNYPTENSGVPPVLQSGADWHNTLAEQVLDAHYLGNPEPVSVHFIDLNNFKHVNDELGHKVGDKVIADIGTMLLRVAGNVGRVGGDEFALSGSYDETVAEHVEEQFRNLFDTYINLPENEQLKRVGFGVAIGRASLQNDMNASELLASADEAMYVDKIDQLPALSEAQHAAVTEARTNLAAVGLRLRDLGKYEKLFKRDT